jgi:2-oxoglutarate ferredoxin oxidoreductase subunit gamma
MNGRMDIRIAGAGGQGVALAGRILAEAAIMSGHQAAHSQVYGPLARGGASRSDVVVAAEAIGFPLAESLDMLVMLSDDAYKRYSADTAEHTVVIVDHEIRLLDGDCNCLPLPMTATARQTAQNAVVTGVVALGALQGHANLVDSEALERAVANRVPGAHRDANLQALAAGIDLAAGL